MTELEQVLVQAVHRFSRDIAQTRAICALQTEEIAELKHRLRLCQTALKQARDNRDMWKIRAMDR